ncbi:MAG: VF530 family protein [Myxococcota bacterium]
MAVDDREQPAQSQPRNPLHGLTLQAILEELVAHHGWVALASMIRINCFAKDPSVGSSLKFLRRTPWARAKVESLYLWHLRELRRRARGAATPPEPFVDTTPDGEGS